MIEEIRCITKKGKTVKIDWENDSDFLPTLYIVYKKLRQFFFHTLLVNVFKQKYISSIRSYKYLNRLISIKTFVLVFLKIIYMCIKALK